MNVQAGAFRNSTDHRFFIGAAVGVASIVFAGFARSYYLRSLFGMPALPLMLHVHGLVMTSWIVLFFTQTCLIAAHRVDWHRRLGLFGAALAVLVVVVGVIANLHAAAGAVRTPPTHPPAFLAIFGFNLVDLLVFATFVGSAIALRRRSDLHKRLMLLATLSMLGQPVARLVSDSTALLLVYLCVLVCVAIDTFRNRRLHLTFAWGAPLLIVSLQLAYLGAQTEAWIRFGRWLLT
ncbi:MAG TPA: hypothetical protein VG222_17985 [Vicinamibacterales bacterium]|jgi:hypothetical protein|nr:hypothetical protein [Vicinamibacterales bacterium]